MASWLVRTVSSMEGKLHQFLKVYLPSSSFNGMHHAIWLIDAFQWWTITPLPVTNGSCACHCDSQCNIISCSSLVGIFTVFFEKIVLGLWYPMVNNDWMNSSLNFLHENQGTLGSTVHQFILIVGRFQFKILIKQMSTLPAGLQHNDSREMSNSGNRWCGSYQPLFCTC